MDHRMSLRRPVRHFVIVVILVLVLERLRSRALTVWAAADLPGLDPRFGIHGLPPRLSRNSFRTTALLCSSSFAP